MKNLILIILITFLAFSCQKESVNVMVPAQVLFQRQPIIYING